MATDDDDDDADDDDDGDDLHIQIFVMRGRLPKNDFSLPHVQYHCGFPNLSSVLV